MDDEFDRNPAIARLQKRNLQSPAYRQSSKLEKKLAKRVGGRRTSGSGNKREKGDVRKKGLARLEHKATKNKSFSVTREMVDKISLAAMGSNEVPALIIEFLDEWGNQETELAVIPVADLMRLLNGDPS